MPGITLYASFRFLFPMSKLVYQCLVCNKVHSTLDAAENCHKGPIQTIEKGITTFSKGKGLLGN